MHIGGGVSQLHVLLSRVLTPENMHIYDSARCHIPCMVGILQLLLLRLLLKFLLYSPRLIDIIAAFHYQRLHHPPRLLNSIAQTAQAACTNNIMSDEGPKMIETTKTAESDVKVVQYEQVFSDS